jgi:hypothetical protein
MSGSKSGLGRVLGLLLVAAAACPASTALAQKGYVIVQPIDVCGTTGPNSPTGCAPFNTSSRSPNPSTATSLTPIGFVDQTTNINLTRAIWKQAGIDVLFLPVVEYNNSVDQVIEVDCSPTPPAGQPCAGTLKSDHLKALVNGMAGSVSGCISNCTVPVGSNAPFLNANAIPMFFVNQLTTGPGVTPPLFGFGFVNGGGIAVASNTFSFTSVPPSRWDTLAHEIGHNLGIDHCTNGAGFQFNAASTTCPTGLIGMQCGQPISTTGGVPVSITNNLPSSGGCNLMDNGSIRILPKSSGCTMQTWAASATSSGGVLYDLDTNLCCTTNASGALVCSVPANTPFNPITDQLVLSTQDTSTFTSQQTAALASGLINKQPNVSAIAGGGGDLPFTVTNNSDQIIAALILNLPAGFNFVGSQIQVLSASPGVKVKSTEILKGNTGSNNNCQKTISLGGNNPSFQCGEIDFQVTETSPGVFTGGLGPGQSITFDANIHNETTGQPATLDQLTCAVAIQFGCLDITEVFVNLYAPTYFFSPDGNASTTDPTVPLVFVNPANFPTLAKLKPPPTFVAAANPLYGGVFACTPQSVDSSFVCPPLAGGDPTGGD